jgi:hypothetical protein
MLGDMRKEARYLRPRLLATDAKILQCRSLMRSVTVLDIGRVLQKVIYF